MLYDRPYMQAPSWGKTRPYLFWILGALVGCFVLQQVLAVWAGQQRFLYNWFACSIANLSQFKVWTLVTYAFLHGGLFHILGNGLAIFFIGRALLPDLGHKRILYLFLTMVAAGGAVWSLVNLIGGPSVLIGASAASFGLLVLFCLMHPHQPISLLLFFILPITLMPKWILWGAIGINVAGFLFGELPGVFGRAGAMGNVAWSAHLGGMLVGYLYYLFWLNPERATAWLPRASVSIEPPRWARRKKAAAGDGNVKLNMTNRSSLKQEVDRILDKINKEGFSALTPEEKSTLDKAKDMLSK